MPSYRVLLSGLSVLAVAACGEPQQGLTRAQLMDPQQCKACHPTQFSEWEGSAHAYAAEDPVFLAMNQRGQRETNGELGDFCVKCHAPMAIREGATKDGLNLASVPKELKGVSCFFCHSVQSVDGTHDAPITLASDLTLRGPYKDPIENTAHHAEYSPHLDRDLTSSAEMCGSCHDIVTGHGASIERTLAEWKGSIFSGTNGATCSQCHMPQSAHEGPIAAFPGAPNRRLHSHLWPAIDVPLTSFPDSERQREQVQQQLDTTLQSALCVSPVGTISVILDNVGAGHSFPSGSSQDRRVWVELQAYSQGALDYQSGVSPDGGLPIPAPDDDVWMMRDCMFDESGKQVSMFWDAASWEGNALPAPVTLDPNDPRYFQTHLQRTFPQTGRITQTIDRVTMKVRVQPIGTDVLDDLIASGDLEPSIRDAMPIWSIKTSELEWTPQTANGSFVDPSQHVEVSCISRTGLNVKAETFPAPVRTRCSP